MWDLRRAQKKPKKFQKKLNRKFQKNLFDIFLVSFLGSWICDGLFAAASWEVFCDRR